MGLGTPTWWGPVSSLFSRNQWRIPGLQDHHNHPNFTKPYHKHKYSHTTKTYHISSVKPKQYGPTSRLMITVITSTIIIIIITIARSTILSGEPHPKPELQNKLLHTLQQASAWTNWKPDNLPDEDNVTSGLVWLHLFHSNSGSYSQSPGKNIIKDNFFEMIKVYDDLMHCVWDLQL